VTLLGLGTACTKQAKFSRHLSRAEDFYQKHEYERAEIEYLNCLYLDGMKVEPVARLGELYFDQGAITRAIPFLKRAKEVSPDNLGVRVRLGLLMLTSGNREEARKEALFVLQKDPLNAEAPLLLVELPRSAAEAQECLRVLQSLPGSAASSAPVLAATGVLKLKAGRIDEGIALQHKAIAANPKSDIPHMILGTIYQAQNDLGSAEHEFKVASELAPDNSSRRTLYAQFKLRQGDKVTAMSNLHTITEKNPSLIQPWMLLAEINVANKNYEEAAKQVGKVISRDPINPEALMMRAKILQAQGNLDGAQLELEKLMSNFPAYGPGALQLAGVYIEKNELSKASALLKQAQLANPNFTDAGLMLAELQIRMNDAGNATVLLEELIKRFPKAPKPRILLASAQRVQGRLEDAIRTIIKLAEDYPKNPQYMMLLGALEMQYKNLSAARTAFENALKLSNNNPVPLEQLINLDLIENKKAEALARVQKLVESDRKESAYQLLLGQVQQACGNLEAAEAAYREAVKTNPEDRNAIFLLARFYVATQKTEKALENLAVVVEKNPKDSGAWMLQGMLLEEKGRYDQAKTAYEKVLAINPKFPAALNNLAYLYSERFNRPAEAQDLATRARELQPNDPYSGDTLGWILYRQGKYAWALNLLKESAQDLPTSPEVQYHLGMIHYMMGEEASARAAFDAAIKLSSDFPGMDDCRRRLQLLSLDQRKPGPELRAALEKLRADQPDDPILLGKLAAVYSATGDRDKAEDTLELIVKLNPQNLAALRDLARLNLEARNWAQASSYAKAARKVVADDPEAGYILAQASMATKDYRYAYSLLKETARKLDDNASVAFDLAEACISQGRLSEAQEVWAKARELESASPRAIGSRRSDSFVKAYRDAQLDATLADEAERTLNNDKTNVPALLLHARASLLKGDTTGAKAHLETVLEKYPDCSPAQKDLAILLVSTGQDSTRAYELAAKAREVYSDDAALARTLGILCSQRGDSRRAVSLLTEAAKTLSDAQLYFHLGLSQAKLKPQPADFKANLQKALSLGLPADLASQAKAALEPEKK
jgi:tetratricopeptide (TPR) repeat protein